MRIKYSYKSLSLFEKVSLIYILLWHSCCWHIQHFHRNQKVCPQTDKLQKGNWPHLKKYPFIQATVYSLSAEPTWIPACTCIFLPGILSTPLSCCHWFLCPLLTAQLFCRVVYTCSLSAYISYSFLNTLWSEFWPPIATEATLFKLIIGFHVTESGGYFQVSPYLTFK